MTNEFLYDFIKTQKYGVLASISNKNKPESALMGFAVTPDLKIVFDTSNTSRKYDNLLLNPFISFVIGWDNEKTVQYEGIVKIPTGKQLKNLKDIYYKVFPEGRERENWTDIVYMLVEPKWIRYSDFNFPVRVEEKYFNSKL